MSVTDERSIKDRFFELKATVVALKIKSNANKYVTLALQGIL
jgi:hypothetical protein